jgi:mycothiol synthase
VRLRPATLDDFDAIFALLTAVEESWFGRAEQTPEEFRQWLTAPTVDLEEDIRLAFDGDRLVGYVDIDRVEGTPVRWWSDVKVHPPEYVPDVVPVLVDWVEQRAVAGIVRIWSAAVATAMRDALESLGYRRTRSSFRMEIPLAGAVEQPRFPEGVTVRTLREGEERDVHAVHQETFADSWEHTEEPFDEWEHWLLRTESFDPSLWFLAWAGDELAGIAVCRDRGGVGWIAVLGVRSRWRRRGLGRALLLYAFGEFKRRGYKRAGLGVDAESLTGANRLYESAGMKVVRQLDFFEKTLEPGSN